MPEMLCREVGEISCRNEQRQARKSQTVFTIRELTGRQLYLGQCFKVWLSISPLFQEPKQIQRAAVSYPRGDLEIAFLEDTSRSTSIVLGLKMRPVLLPISN